MRLRVKFVQGPTGVVYEWTAVDFDADFKTDVATALGVSESRVQIVDYGVGGAGWVTFDVAAAGDDAAQMHDHAMSLLWAVLQMEALSGPLEGARPSHAVRTAVRPV